MASRSRWLVGSSSSSSSDGAISARASARRTRQPPEKLCTGRIHSEAQASNCSAREGAPGAGFHQRRLGLGDLRALVVAQRGAARLQFAQMGVAVDDEFAGGTFVGVDFLFDAGDAPAGRQAQVAGVLVDLACRARTASTCRRRSCRRCPRVHRGVQQTQRRPAAPLPRRTVNPWARITFSFSIMLCATRAVRTVVVAAEPALPVRACP